MTSFGAVPHGLLTAMHRSIARIAIVMCIDAVFWWGLAAYFWWKYRRWGRVPRVLGANDQGLALSRLGWRRMRQQIWPASDIKAIELRPVTGNLNWTRTVADLYIHRHKGRRLHFRLSSPDPQLPARIAEQLKSTLGCSVAGTN